MSSVDTVTKLMAATPAEFARGLERLASSYDLSRDGDATVITLSNNGNVRITYSAREGRRLSPLLVMPAADVTLTFDNVTESERQEFVAKFDLVFQRGGG